MQDNTTKDQDFQKSRRANPIHIVDASRLAASNADALRDVHMSLVRAEQNLFNLVQTSQAANGTSMGNVGYGFATHPAFAGGLAAPAYAPGFPAAATLGASGGLGVGAPNGLGIPAGSSPWGSPGVPAMSAWPIATAVSPWGTLSPAIGGTPTGLAHAAGLVPAAYLQGQSAYGLGLSARTPACDISDEGKQFVCQLDLPGLRADQVEVLVLERSVIINAYRESDTDKTNVLQAERGTASLQRTVTLPNEVQPAAAKATLSNGVLNIVLPKVNPTDGPRRIKVSG